MEEQEEEGEWERKANHKPENKETKLNTCSIGIYLFWWSFPLWNEHYTREEFKWQIRKKNSMLQVVAVIFLIFLTNYCVEREIMKVL